MANMPVIEKFLQAIETAAIPGCDVWAADATLDATVPNWRFRTVGADAIRAEYALVRRPRPLRRTAPLYRRGRGGRSGRVHAQLVGERRAARGPSHAPAVRAR